MNTKEYAIEMLKALDRIKSFSTIEYIQMTEGFGKLWAPIFDEFKEKGVISDYLTPNGYPVNRPYIDALQAEYTSILNTIEHEEEERDLRLKQLAQAIKDSKRAKITSWISIGIALLSVMIALATLLLNLK